MKIENENSRGLRMEPGNADIEVMDKGRR